MLFLIVLCAWVVLFIPTPRWLSVSLTILVCSFGVLLIVGGGCSYWWDSHMQPSKADDALNLVFAGCALLFAPLARKLRPIFGIES